MEETGRGAEKTKVNPYNLIAGAVIVAAIAGVAGFVWYQNFGSPKVRFLAACDDVIKDRLKAPATYLRISETEIERRPATLMEFLHRPTTEQRIAHERLEAADPRVKELTKALSDSFRAGEHDYLSTIIEYDAANGFGTPLRALSECAVVVGKGEPPSAGAMQVMVDNYTSFDWAMKALDTTN